MSGAGRHAGCLGEGRGRGGAGPYWTEKCPTHNLTFVNSNAKASKGWISYSQLNHTCHRTEGCGRGRGRGRGRGGYGANYCCDVPKTSKLSSPPSLPASAESFSLTFMWTLQPGGGAHSGGGGAHGRWGWDTQLGGRGTL